MKLNKTGPSHKIPLENVLVGPLWWSYDDIYTESKRPPTMNVNLYSTLCFTGPREYRPILAGLLSNADMLIDTRLDITNRMAK